MIQGFVPDYGMRTYVREWNEGHPKGSWWGIKTTSEEGLFLGAFRCQNCGFLEFYADPQFSRE